MLTSPRSAVPMPSGAAGRAAADPLDPAVGHEVRDGSERQPHGQRDRTSELQCLWEQLVRDAGEELLAMLPVGDLGPAGVPR
ncbi:hypothetical protein KV102_06580 [Mumia sp. zg.B53]|uniref:hypothetical protein n=1 Tax=Mumia sp. zg.B53 TaxID=2855449 RepID=UPI001C6EC981|nr:hypothetical protein [Mumia sp. zg.B53]MBW9214508.1 hypothetical protein [Mumia sp. zg.B53]